MVKIIGLTGSIATGKSFVAEIFRNKKIEVFSSDYEVSKLILEDYVINQIESNENLSISIKKDKKIDKEILSKLVFKNESNLDELEKILHPLVKKKMLEFISYNESKDFILIEVPLLFERGYKEICHKVITTYCNEKCQRERALRRNNIDKFRLDFILRRQISSKKKALLSDYMIYTGGSYLFTEKQLNEILQKEGIK